MALFRWQFGGTIHDASSSGAVVEIWSCSMSLLANDTTSPSVVGNQVDDLLLSWFLDADTFIHPTVQLEYSKVNDVDILTGRQTTDPTNETLFPVGNRGGGNGVNVYPITTACRIGLDDGTRSRKTRGGFFVPRPTLTLGYNGRWSSANLDAMQLRTATFFNAVNNVAGVSIGVHSRKDKSVTACNRFRIGDVPDNISTRKNAQTESYKIGTLVP